MTIQLTRPAVDKFDPDPAIQEWLKDSKRIRGDLDSWIMLKRFRLHTFELPVAGGEFMER